MTNTARLEHPTLFDIHPEGVEPPVHLRPITPGCLLPAPSNRFIDMKRACGIFNVTRRPINEMVNRRLISAVRRFECRPWEIDYDSIVAFCDSLRTQFCIRDRRPRIAAGRRWRDAELLPFPIEDTVSRAEVMIGLDIGADAAQKMVEEGAFEAYRFYHGSPWRISKTSLFAFRDLKRDEYERSVATRRRARG